MSQANPYRAPQAAVDDEPTPTRRPGPRFPLASRGSRLFAKLIDTAAVFVIFGVAFALFVLSGGLGVSEDTAMALAFATGVAGTIGLLIYNLNRLHEEGQTVGKQLMNIRIVRAETYHPVPLGRLIGLRYLPIYLGSNLPFIGGPLALVNCLMIFANDQRCLHDHIADTTVIDYVADRELMSPHDDSTW